MGVRFRAYCRSVLVACVCLALATAMLPLTALATDGSEPPATDSVATLATDDPATYTLTYDANGGKGKMTSVTAAADTDVSVASCNFTLANYRFVNWNTKADGSGKKHAAGSSFKLKEDTTLYAQWKALDPQKEISVQTQGAAKVAGQSMTGYKTSQAAGAVTMPGSGSTKKTLQCIRLRLKVDKGDMKHYTTGIKYRTLSVGGKWAGWKKNGATAGTSGKTLQALKIKLTGNLQSDFNVYYRIYVADIGWTSWAKNGATCGTNGWNKAARSLQVKVVKESKKVSTGDSSCCFFSTTTSKAVYKAGNKGGSWSKQVASGSTAGKTSKVLTKVSVKAKTKIPGTLKCRAYIHGSKWSSYVSGGKTLGNGKKGISALRMKLSGKISKYYNLYYRVYIKGYGWLGWAVNGQMAGTTLKRFSASAYQVKLALKKTPAPGITSNHSSGKNGVLKFANAQKGMIKRAQKYSSATKYLILINTKADVVGVFTGKKGEWIMLQAYRCAAGKPSTPTIKGQYTTQSKGLSFGDGYTCWYYTQIRGNYMMHSILYNPGSKTSVQDGRLGVNVSHGCVRMALSSAKWIYDNVPLGTKVVIW
ncbi:MAG: InlB B-repeat-containing protein [Coriobacteriaceae bacterium]|nr:InlB B-repeat-containing protein [Coriobacteriaceae bacterium]